MQTNDLVLFLDIAALGSITKAAMKHDISVANASNALIRLERHLGVKLFIRSTRNIRLSMKGKCFLPYAKNVIDSIAMGIDDLGQQEILKGELKITAPSDFGRHTLCHWLDEFLQLHPQVSCHIDLTDKITHFYRDEIDVAIRYGTSNDPSLIVYPLASPFHRIICASPDYLSQHEPILSLEDLNHHKTLLLSLNDRLEDHWILYRGKQKFDVALKSQYNSSDAEVIRQWAIQGRGLTFKALPDVYQDLSAGRLQQVLPQFKSAASALSFISLERPSINRLIAQLRNFLEQKCDSQPWRIDDALF